LIALAAGLSTPSSSFVVAAAAKIFGRVPAAAAGVPNPDGGGPLEHSGRAGAGGREKAAAVLLRRLALLFAADGESKKKNPAAGLFPIMIMMMMIAVETKRKASRDQEGQAAGTAAAASLERIRLGWIYPGSRTGALFRRRVAAPAIIMDDHGSMNTAHCGSGISFRRIRQFTP
jgi:hypothetical protein